jgi:DNA-binding transcriptional regulator YiaG
MPTVYARVLRRGAEILGGEEELATYLGVPTGHVSDWIQGKWEAPTSVFLKAVDIVTRDSAKKI